VRAFRRGIAVLGACGALLAIAAPPTDAKLLKGYCQPTGDYCVSVLRQGGATKLDITTPSLTASYGLCARRVVNGTRECHHFRFKQKAGGLRKSRVDFQTRFGGPPSGRYCATWRYGGAKLHKLCFSYKRQL
jgi:hypothetical protein